MGAWDEASAGLQGREVLVDGLPLVPKVRVDFGGGVGGADDAGAIQAVEFHFLGRVQRVVEDDTVRQFAADDDDFWDWWML